jgi:hypothetical protein
MSRGLRRRVTRHTDLREFVRSGEPDAVYWSKRYLIHPADAAKEYAFLRDASHALREWPALRVVEPVALENDTLITRHAAGVSLSAALQSKRTADAAADVTRAGEWLGRWHSATIVAGGDDVTRIVSDVQRWMTTLGESDDAARIIGRFEAAAARAAGGENWRVRAHGDFGPHNILILREDTIVLDPSFPDDLDVVGNIASPCEDLGRFCAYLRGADELTRSFLNGYNAVAARPVLPSSPMLLLCTARHLLRSMFDWKRRGTPVRLILRRFDRWFAAQTASPRSRIRPKAVALLVGDQIDGPLELLIAQRRLEVGRLQAAEDSLFALSPPIALDGVSEGEVVVVGSRWAAWAAHRGVDVAGVVIPMLRQRFNRVIGLDQDASFQLELDHALVGCFDVVIKSNGIYRDPDLYSWSVGARTAAGRWTEKIEPVTPLSHAMAAALHPGLPSFVTETLEARQLRRELGTNSNAARSLADRLFFTIAGAVARTGIPPDTAHFYGTLTHVQRADALRRLRARRIRVRGGIVGVAGAICGLDGDGMSILDAGRRADVFRGLAAEGLTARPLSRSTYRLSMLRCKAVVSIAGHGEICYRMAEAWAMRRVLVCQDLSHVMTRFPFANGRNVIYCRPDLADLADILEDIECNFRRYELIAEQGLRDWNDWSARTPELLREAFAPLFA